MSKRLSRLAMKIGHDPGQTALGAGTGMVLILYNPKRQEVGYYMVAPQGEEWTEGARVACSSTMMHIGTDSSLENRALALTCFSCAAGPGERCKTRDGGFHEARVARAVDQMTR